MCIIFLNRNAHILNHFKFSGASTPFSMLQRLHTFSLWIHNGNQTFKGVCVFMILWLTQFEVCICLCNCTQSGTKCCCQKRNYSGPSVLHSNPTVLQIYQSKHLFNKCESLAVVCIVPLSLYTCQYPVSNSHKSDFSFGACGTNPVLQEKRTCWRARLILLKVLTCWKEAKLNNVGGLSILHCKPYLFHSGAEMKEIWPTVPRGCNLFTHLSIEVKNTAGDGDRLYSSTVYVWSTFHLWCTKETSVLNIEMKKLFLFSSKSQILLYQPVMFKAFQSLPG